MERADGQRALTEQSGEPTTLLGALVAALQRAGSYNRQDQAPPAAVLWPDAEQQWAPLVPRLRQELPLLTLGPYAPDEHTGPAYWLRCAIAGALPEAALPPDATPILYLPGVSKQELRAVASCPRALQPLAELQYRGVLWTQRNGRDWTLAAFLQSADGGLGIEVAGDQATRQALERALPKLAAEPLARLRQEAPLRAAFFDALLNPDEARTLLLWLADPAAYRQTVDGAAWTSFCELAERKYSFHPERDGPVTAASLLGQREGPWDTVWRRFAEAPAAYPGLPDLLRRARPQTTLPLFYHWDSWPQDNEAAETLLRAHLTNLRDQHPGDARAALAKLEQEHAPRRAWVWAALGQAPLAYALEHLAALAHETERALGGASTADVAAAYAEWGWRADAAAVTALAAVEAAPDVAAAQAAIIAVYRPWLETTAATLQQAVAAGDPARTYAPELFAMPPPGTCILFSDGLRFDAGQRLVVTLGQRGLTCEVTWRLAALPTITATAKPVLSPVADLLAGGPGLDLVGRVSGSRITAEGFRGQLEAAGWQVLRGDALGDPSGRGWAELGDVDGYGHQHGWRLAHHLGAELRRLAERAQALLAHGWREVLVVTDHGWLLLPGGLPKAELPEHLTEVRKGRCARLKASSTTDQQTVPWYWDRDVRIALAPGICCYEAGKEYEHGGLSPQECVVPVIGVTVQGAAAAQTVAVAEATWRGLRCAARIVGAGPDMLVDLRTKAGDPATSLVGVARPPQDDGSVSLLVVDDDQLGAAALIVVLAADGTVLAQAPTVVGGE
jgi:hypothetical protein